MGWTRGRPARLAIAAALLVMLGLPVGPVAAAGDATGPPCANLVATAGSSAGYDTSGNVLARLVLAKPSCANVDYTFYAAAADGTTIASQTVQGDGYVDPVFGPIVTFSFAVPNAPTTIYTYATTSRNGRVMDRGPDSGFIAITLGTLPASRGYG